MSEVKVNKVSPRSGTGLQLGDSGDTITIPSGATLANSGTATGFASIAWQSTVVTGATHTASANQGLWINTTSNACNLTLPGSPSVGDQLIFADFARTWNNNAVTLTLNGSKYQGNTSPAPVYDTIGEAVHIVYSGSTNGWIPINDGGTVMETPQSATVSYLVIAGGAGSGTGANSPDSRSGGGGGAGGYRNSYASETSGGGGSTESTLTFSQGTTYTITVGAGGAGGAGGSNKGTDGSASSISGSDITDVTTVGGGYGGSTAPGPQDGGTGGSGGGAGGHTNSQGNGGAGTANQGFAGGQGGTGGTYGNTGGGGGGAGSGGRAATGSPGGQGGDGVSSSITGSATPRASGGSGTNGGAAPSGGGGTGSTSNNAAGNDGTANTGGGGGGPGPNTGSNPAGGAGGSGVVILRMATSEYSGTTSGSPTVETDGSDTVLTFNASGSYTQ